MSFSVRQAVSGARRFPRILAVFGFMVISGLAQLQSLVNLNP